ncbi:hypothetical protein [Williamsia phyllosphaerae]|uniref:Uncharacterized protein n=1 Tax=Williamsia phyllosphaerae TaxID=885042 RepID=A0ABQ1V5Y5_9NOCA|nr:hypothetical protein [Williamsia phyllosphaerae]GGF40478.1 hypothetical protein GCM10007298_40240 [Williamsia phyllosphaerae]
MWWKIALAILVLWLFFGLIVAAVKGVVAIAVVGLIAVGAFTVVKWFGRSTQSSDTVSGPPTI